jgi:hypothetical protein
MAQSLVPNTEVVISGTKVANTDLKTIYLSAAGIGREHPAPGDAVDILLGLTVHELGHVLFSGDKPKLVDGVIRKLHAITKHLRGGQCHTQNNNIVTLIDVLEDVFVDHRMTAFPGYRDYLVRERQSAIGDVNPESIFAPLTARGGPTQLEMLDIFAYCALLGGKLPEGIPQSSMDILSELSGIAMRMCSEKLSRKAAMVKAGEVLLGLPLVREKEPDAPAESSDSVINEPPPSPEPDASPDSQADSPGDAEETDDGDQAEEGEQDATTKDADEDTTTDDDAEDDATDDSGQDDLNSPDSEDSDDDAEDDQAAPLANRLNSRVNDTTKLESEVAKALSQALVEKRADLTQMVSLLASHSTNTIIAYTPEEDARISEMARLKTSQVEEQIRRVFQDYRMKHTEDYRGVLSGKVSSRRLHRAGYGDKRVFERREKPGEMDMAICLLMDLSGSVKEISGLILQIVVAFTDSLSKEKAEFMALGYSGNRAIVNIPRLYDRELAKPMLHLAKEWGDTPSYEGLAAAIAQLLRLGGNKRKLLFHFTDGHPTSGATNKIPELLHDARSKGITDIHICLGRPHVYFERLYGKVTSISKLEELPGVIEHELRESLGISMA